MSTQFKEKEIQIAHKHTKGCSTSFIIRKMQIKSTQRSFLTYQIGKNPKVWYTSCWQGSEEEALSYQLVGVKMYNPTEGNLTMSATATNAYSLWCDRPNFWECILQMFLLKCKMTDMWGLCRIDVNYKGGSVQAGILLVLLTSGTPTPRTVPWT